jgi:3-oxoadipate enol-lactonase
MKLNYKQVGSGPEHVLVLHDWTSTSSTYEPSHEYLNTKKYTYVFPELRGYGVSKSFSGQYTAAEIASDVLDTADGKGWGRFHLVGHSMNGMSCQVTVSRAQERIRSLVLITPVPTSGVPVDDQGREMFRSASHDDQAALAIMKMLTSERLPESAYYFRLQQLREHINTEAFLGYYDMWTRENNREKVGIIKTPTLVILGAHDYEFFHEENMKSTIGANILEAEYTVLGDSGHYPMLETPPRFVRLLEDFLDDQE